MGRLSLNYTTPPPNAIASGRFVAYGFRRLPIRKTILAFFAPFFYNVEKTARGVAVVSDMELRLEPKQVLQVSPQMLLATRMLLMPAQELSDYLARAAEENPLLERLEPCGFSSGCERTYAVEPPHTAEVGRWDASMTSLAASLTEQIERLRQDKTTTALCTYMVQLLDENGYLHPEDLADIRQLGIEQTLIDRALAILQSLEPAGVGARSTGECLLLQLQRHYPRERTAEQIVTQCLPLLAKKQYAAIARQLGLPESEVRRACGLIQRLEPYPAGREEPAPEPVYVLPDITVEETDGQWCALLNDRYLPQFSISRQYVALLERSDEEEVRRYLKQKLRQAQWMLSCLEKRQHTLQRCGDLILHTQERFFRGETAHLSPMTLREAAVHMQLHESTVGRCVKGKYLQCRQGVFPLRYFFSGSVNGCSGQALRMELRALIRTENIHSPLSDQAIARLLGEKGMPIARRTVAKYREELGIPPAYRRKRT